MSAQTFDSIFTVAVGQFKLNFFHLNNIDGEKKNKENTAFITPYYLV